MAIAGQHCYAGGRVDLSTGRISCEIFVNEDVSGEDLATWRRSPS